MKIRVEVNGLVYDSENTACKCILAASQGKVYAYIQVLDDAHPRRYWGEYSHEAVEASLKEIMLRGGKWPHLPE